MSQNSSNPQSQFLAKRLLWAVAAIAWVIATYVLAVFLASIIIYGLSLVGVRLDSLGQNVGVFIANVIVWLIMMVILIGVPRKLGLIDKLLDELGLTRLLSWSDIGLALLAFVPYVILSQLFDGIVTNFLPSYDAGQTQELGFSQLSQQFDLLLAFIALVVLAPLIEEIIFRGFLFGKLKKHIGRIAAIILTSLVFAVLHLQLNVGIDVFALSLMLCVLREVTGSIWAGVVLHMTKNGLAYYVLFILPMVQ